MLLSFRRALVFTLDALDATWWSVILDEVFLLVGLSLIFGRAGWCGPEALWIGETLYCYASPAAVKPFEFFALFIFI